MDQVLNEHTRYAVVYAEYLLQRLITPNPLVEDPEY